MSKSAAKRIPSDLEARESVIEGALRTFVDVGRALGEIRDLDLYKERGYRNFDAYCKERWAMRRDQADRFIRCAKATLLIEANWPELPPPSNEAQARPLAAIDEEQVGEVWTEVVETAPPSGITARHVESVVRAHLPPDPEKRPEPFHLLVAISDLRAKVRAAVAGWPLESQRDHLPTVLRDFADEYAAAKK